jgi:hypothetical protein
MKIFMSALLLILISSNTFAASKTKNIFYSNVTSFRLDPKLPEPFARTIAAQIMINEVEQDASLIFIMDENETEGIEVTFPTTSDSTDACNVRTIVAAPPEGTTPYYNDFEIKIIDSSNSKCPKAPNQAPVVATLRTYEVGHKSTTLSTLLADKFKKVENQNN